MPTPSKNQSHEGEILKEFEEHCKSYEDIGVEMCAKRIADWWLSKLATLQKDYEAKVVEKIKYAKPLGWMCSGENHSIIGDTFHCKTCEENKIRNETRTQLLTNLQTELKENKND